ncbi:hypothetical protein B5P46_23605 [Rhizobium leguminosarum]|uniref:Uncharacterized protein n=1 Tax=Rhizobium leguminosarum TaxID=384 RepID=A0A4Q1TQX3_RHILE|nr:hypothetical protein [Rhizobium leguminosarum]RXT21184.1 hypothetical protein B5P46_23605 [Rhizobium leguminosarum]
MIVETCPHPAAATFAWVIAIISEMNRSDAFAHTGDADMVAWVESAAMWTVLNVTERLASIGYGLMPGLASFRYF